MSPLLDVNGSLTPPSLAPGAPPFPASLLTCDAIAHGRIALESNPDIRQKRIARIEHSLDISFGPVGEWDVLADTRADEALGEEGILISTPSDMRVNGRRRAPAADG